MMKLTICSLAMVLSVALPVSQVAAEPAEKTEKTEKSTDKKKPLKIGRITFEGGDGSSIKEAVLIKGAKDTMEGVEAESKWIEKKHRGWTKGNQALMSDGGRQYDRIEYTTRKGEKQTIYFDVTEFYGK